MPEQPEGGTGFYPGSTEIEQHVSIFLLGFRHAVSDRNAKNWIDRVSTLGWLPHPYLRSEPMSAEAGCQGRLFAPHDILTPTALRTILGSTWGDGGSEGLCVIKVVWSALRTKNRKKRRRV